MPVRAALPLLLACCAFAAPARAASLAGPAEARAACRAAAEARHAPALARAQLRKLTQDAAQIRDRIEAQLAACVGWAGRPGAMPAGAAAVHDATLEGITLDMHAADVVATLRRAGYRNPARPEASLPEMVVAAARPGTEFWDRISQIRALSADGATFVDVRLAIEPSTGTARVVEVRVSARSASAARGVEKRIAVTPGGGAAVEPWTTGRQHCANGLEEVRVFEYRSAPPVAGAGLAGTSVLRGRIGAGCEAEASVVLERVGGVPVSRDLPTERLSSLRY